MKDTKRLKERLHGIFFGDYANKLDEWYKQILKNEARYVVFIEEKCYNLALYMEYISENKMNDNSDKEYLTVTSFLSRCEELADYYRKKGRFPKILICEYALTNGININHLLEFLENNLCDLLTEKYQIETALIYSINIFTLKKMSPLVLLGRYELNVEYIEIDDGYYRSNTNICNRFVHNSSRMLYYLNNIYDTYSVIISDDIYNEIHNSSEWKKTYHYQENECFKFEYVKSNNRVKAIYSMKLRKLENECRLIPYVILPNLDTTETINIKNEIFNKLSKDKRWKNIEKEMEIWSNQNIFYEWLNLLMSQVFLKELIIKNKYNLEDNKDDYDDQIEKLMRKYNTFGVDKTFEILDFTLNQNVLNFIDLNSILIDNIKDHYILDIDEKEKNVNKTSQLEIKSKIENYLYERAFKEEEIAYELRRISYVPTERRSLRLIRACNYTLRDLNEGYSKEETEYMLAYFLQMLDSYLFTISSYPSKGMNVLGFSQFIKVNRESLLLYPLNLYEYIPLLTRIERVCKLNRLSVEKAIIDYFNSGKSDISKTELLKILNFTKKILEIGQGATDWCYNYLGFIPYDQNEYDGNTHAKSLRKIIDKQDQHVDKYKSYNNKIPRY